MKQEQHYGQCVLCASDTFACLDRNDPDKNPSEFDSQTIKCRGCGECFLYVRHGNRSTQIHLRQFLHRRGDGPERTPLDKYSMAQDLFNAMIADWWPSVDTCMHFGIETPQHYQAVRRVVYQGAGPYELDRVLGDGKAMTRLFRFICHDSELPGLHFSSPYDIFHEAVESGDA